jgi:hypothetical protein
MRSINTLTGSSASGGTLTISSTSNATKGKINLGSASAYDEANTRLGIGTTSPGVALDVVGQVSASTIAQAPTVQGGTGSGGTLTLKSTTNATKGKILLGTSAYDEVNNRLGIGNAAPSVALDITGAVNTSGNVTVGGDLAVTGIGKTIYVEKSGAATNATTTMADITSMAFTAIANAKYLIQCRFSYDAPTATDIKIAWTIPSLAVMQRNIIAPAAAVTDNVSTSVLMIRRGAGTAQVAGGPGSVSSAFSSWWEDILYIGGANGGTCQLQFAANAAGTATFNDQSYFLVTRIA